MFAPSTPFSSARSSSATATQRFESSAHLAHLGCRQADRLRDEISGTNDADRRLQDGIRLPFASVDKSSRLRLRQRRQLVIDLHSQSAQLFDHRSGVTLGTLVPGKYS